MIRAHYVEVAKHVADVASVSAITAAWVDHWVTPMSTIIAFLYLSVRLFETKTMQHLVRHARRWLHK